VDQAVLPDAEIVLNGIRYWVELDTGKMAGRQLKRRFRKYVGQDDTILFVTLGREKRIRNVLRVAGDVADILVVTSFARVYEDPFGRVWGDTNGKMQGITRPEIVPEILPEIVGAAPAELTASQA